MNPHCQICRLSLPACEHPCWVWQTSAHVKLAVFACWRARLGRILIMVTVLFFWWVT
jgi:hypothetical protein